MVDLARKSAKEKTVTELDSLISLRQGDSRLHLDTPSGDRAQFRINFGGDTGANRPATFTYGYRII